MVALRNTRGGNTQRFTAQTGFRYSPIKFLGDLMTLSPGMRTLLTGTVFVATAAIALVAQNPPGPQNPQQLPPGTASIAGIVVAMGTNQPISAASVEVRRLDCNNFNNPPEVHTTTTGTDGRFTFQNVRA